MQSKSLAKHTVSDCPGALKRIGEDISDVAPAAKSMKLVGDINSSYMEELRLAWSKVKSLFPDVERMMPESISMSSFDLVAFQTAMASGSTYSCGGNILWADPFYSASPSVPVNRNGAPPPSQCVNHRQAVRHNILLLSE